jgi:hypothetical protein
MTIILITIFFKKKKEGKKKKKESFFKTFLRYYKNNFSHLFKYNYYLFWK